MQRTSFLASEQYKMFFKYAQNRDAGALSPNFIKERRDHSKVTPKDLDNMSPERASNENLE